MYAKGIIDFIEKGETDEVKLERLKTLPDMLGKHVSQALEHLGSGKPETFAKILIEADELQESVCQHFNVGPTKKFSTMYTEAMWDSGKFPAFTVLRIREILHVQKP